MAGLKGRVCFLWNSLSCVTLQERKVERGVGWGSAWLERGWLKDVADQN